MMRIVVRAEDELSRLRAKKLGYELVVSDGWEIAGPTLFAAGTIPWEMLAAGFGFIERWDAAAPLSEPRALASELGDKTQRARTLERALDLRIPVYDPGMLFAADTEAGRALVETWRRECGDDPPESPRERRDANEKLAFVRALHLVKPCFCVLPRTWLLKGGSMAVAVQDRGSMAATVHRGSMAASERGTRRGRPELVMVQVGPKQFVKCKPGDEEGVLKRFQKILANRQERRRM